MKKIVWIGFLFSLSILSFLIMDTYALFEDNASGEVSGQIGRWNIKLNDVLVSGTTTSEITLDDFTYNGNENVKSGLMAPGTSGYYDIVLDATNTDVSVKYTIIFDLENIINNSITLNVENLDGLEITSLENGVFNGVFSLEDMTTSPTTTLRINLNWVSSDATNETDVQLGKTYNGKIEIPVTINLTQEIKENEEEIEE